MERRKASPEQLIMLLHLLEKDRNLAMGRYTGLEGKIRHTNFWLKITQKLNASSGPTKTPDKWQQTWRDWKSNVRKKAFKIQNNQFTSNVNTQQLSETEQKILTLDPTQTQSNVKDELSHEQSSSTMDPTQTQSNVKDELSHEQSSSTMFQNWSPEPDDYKTDLDISLEADVSDPDAGMGPNEVSSAPITTKPIIWKRAKPARAFHDRLLTLEEEKLKIKKQKLLENKRCNNLRMKIEKDRLEIEKQRNSLLEKLLNAVEAVAKR